MKRIALKIDVDTCRGTLFGVPALIELLQRHEASGTFFFSLGPDHSGREARQLSPNRYYDLVTRLYGLLLPAPDMGACGADHMRQALDAGFEVGIHGWNRVRWEGRVATADNAWTEAEVEQARRRFAAIFGEQAQAHAAPGWRVNRHALRLTQRLGFCYASDCRGNFPFIPVIDGELVLCPQLPTTLPALDELLVTETTSVDQAVERILAESTRIDGDHVFTLRAELEGMKYKAAFEGLLVGWTSRGYQQVALRDLLTSQNIATLPRHTVVFAEVPGRVGRRLVQGRVFLDTE
ncbi:polysaccharide deacetylase family protein [Accumulibacter sp.]|uniref:Polysaccharide deacetylase family protein n=1 Tax=Candidatus Accumulibacter proximus TaxID=2954385 RepID=A0A935Q4F1_9PROT|nr:polysaccharide deacetylase family protein [Accumulibacter sp.]MBK7676905.1 polysaccharide deacetylase family protein [Candidatus Accumulibacter proximus]MBL8375868.1 polysaccharide deacetylase family protein [Accumulibacter sp.]